MKVRFGEFTLDSDARRLIRQDGEEIHLSPKAFELLSLPIEKRTKAVSKAELQERLWPSTYALETEFAGFVAGIRRALRGNRGAAAGSGLMRRDGRGNVPIDCRNVPLDGLLLSTQRRRLSWSSQSSSLSCSRLWSRLRLRR